MKTIKKDEIYNSLNGFLKSKGIKLSHGTYSRAVRKACGFLTDAVHLAQEGVQKTKVTVDSNLDKLRSTIHEATAPRPPKLAPNMSATKKKAARGKTAPKTAVKKKAAGKKPAARKPTSIATKKAGKKKSAARK